MKEKHVSRRRFIGTSVLAVAGIAFASKAAFASDMLLALAKPNSKINGVQLGVITYSFRSMPGTIEDILKYCIACNINAIELMGDAAEAYAGAPKRDGSADYAKTLAAWRENTIMDSFAAIREMYNKAGVSIYAWKPNALGAKNTDAEVEYAFKAGKALGCSHVTVELPEDAVQTQRLGDIAEQNGMMVGYHAHAQATPELWDIALSQSAHNGINLDVGHYVAGTSASPLDFITKNHKRIVSMHLKDRRSNNGPNMPWGEGNTPIKEVLQLVKKNGYKFPVTIELEYKIPDGSDAVKEVIKCRDYAKGALS